MANYYIDPTWTGPFNGTEAQPYANFPTVSSNNNYYLKAGTTLNRTTRVDFNNLSNITIDSYGEGEKPKIKVYSFLYQSSSFTEVDTNIWVYDSGSYTYDPIVLLGLGTLGDKDNPSWTSRVGYLGGGTGTGVFDEYGQYDFNTGSAINSAKLYIYSDENPIDKWGIVYYAKLQQPIFLIRNTCSNVSINNIHGYYGGLFASIFGGSGGQITTGVTVSNCIIEHSYRGINLGSGGTLDNLTIENNKIYVAANVGIYTFYSYSGKSVIRGNEIYDTGINGAEGIGGIYGTAISTIDDPLIIEDNIVDGTYQSKYWAGECHGLYSESGSYYVIWRRNTSINHARSGCHCNFSTGIQFIANKIYNCKNGITGDDPSSVGSMDISIYNNTIKDVLYGVNFTSQTSPTIDIEIYNNIFIAGDYSDTVGIRFNTSIDNTGNVLNDNNIIYGFDNTILKTDGSATSTALGSNSITTNPYLDKNLKLTALSPGIRAGKIIFGLKDYLGHKYKYPPSIGAYEYRLALDRNLR